MCLCKYAEVLFFSHFHFLYICTNSYSDPLFRPNVKSMPLGYRDKRGKQNKLCMNCDKAMECKFILVLYLYRFLKVKKNSDKKHVKFLYYILCITYIRQNCNLYIEVYI